MKGIITNLGEARELIQDLTGKIEPVVAQESQKVIDFYRHQPDDAAIPAKILPVVENLKEFQELEQI